MSEFDIPPESALLELPRIDPLSLNDSDRDHYIRYELALAAVYQGTSIRQAARFHSVRKNTLSDIVAESQRVHPDGKLVGFRACARRHRRVRNSIDRTDPKSDRPPKSLSEVLSRVPEAAAMLEKFRGRLPEKNRPSKTFETLLQRFLKAVENAGYGGLPIWDSAYRGRRAIVRRLRSMRAFVPATEEVDSVIGTEHATRLDQLFDIEPLDRVEGDEHRTDVHWQALVPTRTGGWITRAISYLLLTIFLDVGSRAIIGWRIVVGRRFTRFDLLRLAARCLRPWQRRDLVVEGLRYHPEAWMPSAVACGAAIRRFVSLALDSAMAHLAHDATNNLAAHFKGITNLGFPRNPRGRPYIEALFKKFENLLFRLLAGGFRPPGEIDPKEVATTNRRPEDYPIELEALDDLMDVVVSAYNVTPQDQLGGRSPKEVFQAYCGTTIGAFSTRTDSDAAELVAIHVWVRLRGKHKKRQPHVKWKHAVYRGNSLNGDYSSINEKFFATIDADDVRKMVLWRDGKVFAVLHAIAPWAASAHDIETRERAETCRRRGFIQWEPFGDAVKAYEGHVRKWASTYTWAAEEFLRMNLYDAPANQTQRPMPAPKRSAIFDLPPRRRH